MYQNWLPVHMSKFRCHYSHAVLMFGVFFTGGNVLALFFPLVTKLVFLFSLFYFLFVTFFWDRKLVFCNGLSNVVVYLVLFWFFLGALATLISQSDLYGFLKYIFYIAIFLLYYFSLGTNKSIEQSIGLYAYLIATLSILGVLFFYFKIFFGLPELSSISYGGKTYQLYGFFSLIDKDSQIEFSSQLFTRFQSLFDEPGSYAFFILPVFFYFKNIIIRFLILICLLSSFSTGAILLFLLIIYVLLVYHKPLIALYFSLFAVFVIASFFSIDNPLADFLMYKFGLGDYSSEHTSGGVRYQEYRNMFDVMGNNPYGIGLLGHVDNIQFGSGIIKDFIYSGVIGATVIFMAYFLVLFLSFKSLINGSVFYFSLGISLVVMSLQRASLLQSLLSLLLLAIFLKSNHLILRNKNT